MMHHRFCKEVIETPTIATLAACGIDCKQRISFRATYRIYRRIVRTFGSTSPVIPKLQQLPQVSSRSRGMAKLRTGGDADNACLNAAVCADNLVIRTDREAMR
jgi:hypothetical protein